VLFRSSMDCKAGLSVEGTKFAGRFSPTRITARL
jgi:hypothetical protein